MDFTALEREAAARLPPHVTDYVRATSGGAEVLAEATAAWEAFRHRPRVLRDSGSPVDRRRRCWARRSRPRSWWRPWRSRSPRTRTGRRRPRGRRPPPARCSASRRTRASGSRRSPPAGRPVVVPAVRAARPRVTEALLDRAVAAGASAVILTADITGLCIRRPAPRTRWSRRTGVTCRRRAGSPTSRRPSVRAWSATAGGSPATSGFGTIGWLRERTGLPVVVKGVLRGDDARRARRRGRRGRARLDPRRARPRLLRAVGPRAGGGRRRGGRCGRGLRRLRSAQRPARRDRARPRGTGGLRRAPGVVGPRRRRRGRACGPSSTASPPSSRARWICSGPRAWTS